MKQQKSTIKILPSAEAGGGGMPVAGGQRNAINVPDAARQLDAEPVSLAAGRPKAKARLRKPYLQGDLDGLCGVYSAVNAARALCPEVDHDAAEWLFDELMRALPKVEADASVAVASGLGKRHLVRLLKRAVTYLGGEHDIKLGLTRPPEQLLAGPANLDALWAWLERRVSARCMAVLGLEGRYHHWTVAIGVTPAQIRLFDSDNMSVLNRGHCTFRRTAKLTRLLPSNTFLITRHDVT